ncbi:catalase-like domain-containing protein [Zopfochytrium polystomum]|nr:catalase-like domain-containing protein [Zopfochytrium polystomum]
MARPVAATLASTVLPTRAKLDQLAHYTVQVPADGSFHVTTFGSRVDGLDSSVKAGPRGPVELADTVAREKISHFDHERIPERVVHARGVGAHGHFVLHTSLEEYTTAPVLTTAGRSTPTVCAAETAREVRGFATRFYTSEGNWDIVGNNIPVFFIQDGMQFPDLIHAGKPEPQLNMPQAQTAHDSFWDFISFVPESTHMIMWMLSQYTTPRSYRMMPGFGVNTYVFVNAAGKRFFVKFHWKPHLGRHGLIWDECLKLGGQDPDFLRRDLAEAIEAGTFPKYEFGVQLIPEENEHDFDFDLLDCTKLVPEELVPIKWVGTMTLDRNPTDYFAEVEQVAFCVQHLVPGIELSLDPMLTTRAFSYFDTQLIRLGGPNFNQIPINKPLCPFITTLRDGFHQATVQSGPNYFPNRFNIPRTPSTESGDSEQDTKATLAVWPQTVSGTRGRHRGPKFAEHYDQARMVCDKGIREIIVTRFAKVDLELAMDVAVALSLHETGNPISMLSSDNTFTATGRKLAIMALDGIRCIFGVVVQLIGTRPGRCIPRGRIGESDAGGGGSGRDADFGLETARSDHRYVKGLKAGRCVHWAREMYGTLQADCGGGDGRGVNCRADCAICFWVRAYWLPRRLHREALPTKIDTEQVSDDGKYVNHLGVLLAPSLKSDESGWIEKLTCGASDSASFGGALLKLVAGHRFLRACD